MNINKGNKCENMFDIGFKFLLFFPCISAFFLSVCEFGFGHSSVCERKYERRSQVNCHYR